MVFLVLVRLLRATTFKNEQVFETGRRERDAEARMPNRPVAVREFADKGRLVPTGAA